MVLMAARWSPKPKVGVQILLALPKIYKILLGQNCRSRVFEENFGEAELQIRADLPLNMNKVAKFLKEVQTELKKVIWPTREQAVRLTMIVVGVSLTVGLYVGILDYVLTKLVGLIVR